MNAAVRLGLPRLFRPSHATRVASTIHRIGTRRTSSAKWGHSREYSSHSTTYHFENGKCHIHEKGRHTVTRHEPKPEPIPFTWMVWAVWPPRNDLLTLGKTGKMICVFVKWSFYCWLVEMVLRYNRDQQTLKSASDEGHKRRIENVPEDTWNSEDGLIVIGYLLDHDSLWNTYYVHWVETVKNLRSPIVNRKVSL